MFHRHPTCITIFSYTKARHWSSKTLFLEYLQLKTLSITISLEIVKRGGREGEVLVKRGGEGKIVSLPLV